MSANWFLIALAAYVLGLTALSFWVSRRKQSAEEFLLADRSIPFLLSLGTTIATLVGTGSTIGAVSQGYLHGWRGAMYGIGGGLGLLLLAALFGDARRLGFMTMPEELSYYYGANRPIKHVVACFMLLASLGWLGAHILGGSYYLQYVGGLSPFAAKISVAAGFSLFIVIGGYLAVVWVDTIQAVLLFVGFVMMAVVAYGRASSPAEPLLLEPGHFAFLRGDSLLPSVSLAFAICVGVLATPSFRQRIYSAQSVSAVRRSFVASGFGYLLFCGIPAVIGICARRLNPTLENPDHTFLYVAQDMLPASVGYFVLICGMSATMSSASSDAIAAVSILLRDLFQMITGKMPRRENAVTLSRWGVVAVMGLALLVTLTASDIITYIQQMISLVMSGMVSCALLGKFWPRATWQGGLACFVGGATCSCYFLADESLNSFWGGAAIPSVAAALVAGVVVSLLTPPNEVTAADAFDRLLTERSTLESAPERL
jgi:SSS family solute:Na+ symporter